MLTGRLGVAGVTLIANERGGKCFRACLPSSEYPSLPVLLVGLCGAIACVCAVSIQALFVG